MAAKLMEVDSLADWLAIVPVAAVGGPTGPGVAELAGVLGGAMGPGPRWYPEGEATDQLMPDRIAELVREAAIELVEDELPHSVAVTVDEFAPPFIRLSMYVERDSQKGILIGHRGSMLKRIGTKARNEIEALTGSKVFIDIHVKVAKLWQRDPKALRKLGF
jgi:GTP-binding protein Era